MILRLILTVIVAALVLSGCPIPDAPPTMFAPALIAGDGQLTASWAELAAIWNEVNKKDGQNVITSYNLRYGEFGSENWTEINTGITGASHTITDLTNGLSYAVQVRAVNAGGTGGWSASAAATPTAFLAISAPLLTVENGTITASWNALNGHNVTAYHLRYSEKDSGSWTEITKGITATSYPIVGLTNGTSYDVQVRAVNAQGTGGWSPSSTATLVTAPAAPGTMAAPTFEAGTGLLIATWTAPENDGGSPITGYELQYRTDDTEPWTRISSGIACENSEEQAEVCHFSFSFNPSYTGHTITGMTDSALYQMQVRAVNAQGVSEWSGSTMLPFATQLPAGSPASVPLSADSSNTLIANEDITVSLTTVEPDTLTVDNSGDITAVTPETTPGGVTIPTVDSSSGLITVTVSASTTAGTYVVYGTGTGDTLLFAEYFFVTESPTTNAELKTAVTEGISTWGNTANLNYIVTAAVTDMSFIFSNSPFAGNISGWDVSSVTNMENMFWVVATFNSDISGWDVSSVTNMTGMFNTAGTFNNDISGWNVSSVTHMNAMFNYATAFTQNLEEWKEHWTLNAAGKYTGNKTNMFNNSGVNTANGNVPTWF